MSVKVIKNRIVLSGRCGVEEAETLLSALISAPKSVVVLEAERMHTALWQVLLALKPRLEGEPNDAFALKHLFPRLVSGAPHAS